MGDAIKDRLFNNGMAVVLVRKAIISALQQVLIQPKRSSKIGSADSKRRAI
jgi:hypothetical protein